MLLGRKGPYLQKSVAYVEDLIDRHAQNEALLAARMMEILLRYRQGDPAKYAALAHEMGDQHEAHHNWFIAEDYWNIEAKWHAMAGDAEQERVAKMRAAETYVHQAEDLIQVKPPSYISATAQIERAIEAYRRIGNADQRIQELRRLLASYQKESMKEMRAHSVEVPDAGKLVERAIDAVKGKSLDEAITSLALIYHPRPLEEASALVAQLRAEAPISLLASHVLVDDQGRATARKPAISINAGGSDEAMDAELAEVVSHNQQFVTRYLIEPARQQLTLEHYVDLRHMEVLVANSPFVPPEHEEFFARGLLAGFRNDFMVAAHLLVPQLEESIRHLLILYGHIPYGLNDSMIQNAYLLDQVIRLDETEQLLSEEVAFDLKTLLVHRFGSNLRNRQSHGLMKAQEFHGWTPVYAWWLVLHLCRGLQLVSQDNPADDQLAAGADNVTASE
jgi:hypothetical protein